MGPQGSREYGVEHAIGSTLEFWERRAANASRLGPLNVTMLQDGNDDLAAGRDRVEKEALLQRLQPTRQSSVLDVGCGAGRWAHDLVGKVDRYLGFDFSAGLIDLGRRELSAAFPEGGWELQVLSATQIMPSKLAVPPPFDKVIISGVCLYMNDEDVRTSLTQLAAVCAPKSTVVIKDSVALGTRLTLDGFYSQELESEYSAVYRDEATFASLLGDSIVTAGFVLTESAPLYPQELTNRKETEQHFFALERSPSR